MENERGEAMEMERIFFWDWEMLREKEYYGEEEVLYSGFFGEEKKRGL